MSRPDDVPFEMDTTLPTDRDAEQLLRGASVDGFEGAAGLAQALRRSSTTAPAPGPELYALLTEGFEPGAVEADVDVPVWPVAAPSRPLRSRAAAVLGLSLGAKVLLGTGAAVAGVTVAATTGALPPAVSDGVAAVIRAVTPFDVSPEQGPERETGSRTERTPAATPAVPPPPPRERPATTPSAIPAVPPAAPAPGSGSSGDRATTPQQPPAPAPAERPYEQRPQTVAPELGATQPGTPTTTPTPSPVPPAPEAEAQSVPMSER